MRKKYALFYQIYILPQNKSFGTHGQVINRFYYTLPLIYSKNTYHSRINLQVIQTIWEAQITTVPNLSNKSSLWKMTGKPKEPTSLFTMAIAITQAMVLAPPF